MAGSPHGQSAALPARPAARGAPRWLRWLLSKWYALVVFVALALVGNILVVPLGQGFAHWGTGIISQINALLDAARTQPVITASAVASILLLSVLGFVANRSLGIEDRETRDEASLARIIERLNERGSPADATLARARRLLGMPRPASIIGRDTEIERISAQLRSVGQINTVVLEGMPGVGKSALAAKIVLDLNADETAFPGQAAWINCEGLTGADGQAKLWTRVANALSLDRVAAIADPQMRGSALSAILAQGPRTLLALDNVGPGLDTGAVLDALAIPGHTALLLTTPQAIATARAIAFRLEPLGEATAEELFAQRLHQADASRPNAEDRPLIPALVARLAGLPLAIELTAAYAGKQYLKLTTVLNEIEAAIAVSSDPQQTLTTRFDHSWSALDAAHQDLFAGLSLLGVASFPRGAALALSAAAGGAANAPDGEVAAATRLAELIAFMLVEPLAGERLQLHPLVRTYAARRLTQLPYATQERLGDAAVAFWLAFGSAHSEASDASDRAAMATAMSILAAEAPGMLAALEWAHGHERHRALLDLEHTLSRFWSVRGRVDDARQALPWAQEAAIALRDATEERWAAHELGELEARTGDLVAARTWFERARTLAQATQDARGEGDARYELALLDERTGNFGAARSGFGEALALARRAVDRHTEVLILGHVAELDTLTGQPAEAQAGYTQALALAREAHDWEAEGLILRALAQVTAFLGEKDAARQLLDQALQLAQQTGDLAGEHDALSGLAHLDADTWRLREARVGFERALELARQLKDPSAVRGDVQELATIERRIGDPQAARAGFDEALELARRLKDPISERHAVHNLAMLDAQVGDLRAARAGFDHALEMAAHLHDPAAERADIHEQAALDWREHNLPRARAGFMQAMELARRVHQPDAEHDELHSLGLFDIEAGDYAAAREKFQQALALASRLGNPAAQRADIHQLAVMESREGHLDEARAGFERALALARQLTDRGAERTEIHCLADLDARTGQTATARAGFEQALGLAMTLLDPAAERADEHALAGLDAQAGQLASARDRYWQALALARSLNERASECAEMLGIAHLDEREGKTQAAQTGFEQALALARDIQDPGAEAAALLGLGLLRDAAGEAEPARELITQALAISEATHDLDGAGEAYRALGRLDAQQGQTATAREHLQLALSCFERVYPAKVEDVHAMLARLPE